MGNINNKYKIEFFAANGLLSTTLFNDKHRVFFDEGYMKVKRNVAGSPRTVFSVKEDRVSRVYRYDELVWQQYIGYVGAH